MKRLIVIIVLILVSSIESFAGIMPIFLYGGGGGNLSQNDGIGLLIALNIPLILTYVVRAIIWAVNKHSDYSFVTYVIWDSDLDLVTPNIISIFFASLNGLALLVAMAMYFSSII